MAVGAGVHTVSGGDRVGDDGVAPTWVVGTPSDDVGRADVSDAPSGVEFGVSGVGSGDVADSAGLPVGDSSVDPSGGVVTGLVVDGTVVVGIGVVVPAAGDVSRGWAGHGMTGRSGAGCSDGVTEGLSVVDLGSVDLVELAVCPDVVLVPAVTSGSSAVPSEAG